MISGIRRRSDPAPETSPWRRKAGRQLLAAAAAAAAIMAIGVPAASADTGPFMAAPLDPPGVVTPVSSGIGGPLCVDDWSNSSVNYSAVVINACNGTAAQQWDFVSPSNTVRINGLCLDVYAGGTADGTPVDIYVCNGTGAQTWIWQSDQTLYNPQSGKCLDDTGWSTTPGTQLQIWDCAGSANQQWYGNRQPAS
jgi:hypothetical protein